MRDCAMSLPSGCGQLVKVTGRSWARLQQELDPGDLCEAIQQVFLERYRGLELKACLDMGRIVGQNSCLAIQPHQNTMFACYHGGRFPLSITHIEPVDTCKITVIIRKIGVDWVLVAAHYGPPAPRNPLEYEASHRNKPGFSYSMGFWSRHALVWDPVKMGAPFRSAWNRLLQQYQ